MVKGIRPHQLTKKAGDNGLNPQDDHKEVGYGAGKNEPVQAVRLPQTGVIQIETSAFEVRKEGFGGDALGVVGFGLVGSGTVGHEEPMLVAGGMPHDQDIDRADVVLLGKADLGQESFLTLGQWQFV